MDRPEQAVKRFKPIIKGRDKMTKETKFRSISISSDDYDDYEKLRVEFALEKGIPTNKVSLAMIINIGMKFYKQRRKAEASK